MTIQNKSVTEIVNRLDELQQQQKVIISEQEALLQQLQQLSLATHNQHNPEVISSTGEQATPPRSRTQETHTTAFRAGEHIYVKNKISHAMSTDNTPLHRASVVTNIQQHKVYTTAYSGVEIWRSPYNLQHLTEKEKQQLKPSQEENE